MLTDAQVELFNTQGFLVIENVLDEDTVLRPLKAEYNARLDQLMHAWVAEGRVPDTPRNADFSRSSCTVMRMALTGFSHWTSRCQVTGSQQTPPFTLAPLYLT